VLLLIIFLSYFFSTWKQKREPFKNPISAPLLLWFGWALAESFNPQITNFAVPLLGLRMSFIYVPLIYLGYWYFETEERVRTFSLYMLEAGAVVSFLGIMQSFIGLDFLNPGADPYLRLRLIRYVPGTNEAILRPTGTFVDAGRFAQYLFVVAFIGLGLLAYLYSTQGAKNRKLILLPMSCWMVVLAGIFVSGQRSVLLLLLGSFALLIPAYIFAKRGRKKVHNLRPVLRAVSAGGMALLLLYLWLPGIFHNVLLFYDQTMNPESRYSEVSTRSSGYWGSIGYAYQNSGLIGYGTGSASLGLQYLYKTVSENEYTGLYHVEGGYASVLWEWGVVGLILWLLWTVLLLRAMAKKIVLLRGTPYYWLGVAIACYSASFLVPLFYLGFQVYQNYISQAFFWFLVGLFFRLSVLARVDSRNMAVVQAREAGVWKEASPRTV
jgi:hypothetical protein